jgi:hypothetical protein
MSKVISLREIIAALEAASDDCTSYLDPETGEIVVVTEEERALAEDPCWEEAPAWQREMMPKIRAALESDRFLELPDRFDIHEWSIMERFSRAQNIEQIRGELLNAIRGAGAFRAFRSAIRRLGLEQSWYQFRDEALAEIARSWLEEHKLQYTKEVAPTWEWVLKRNGIYRQLCRRASTNSPHRARERRGRAKMLGPLPATFVAP